MSTGWPAVRDTCGRLGVRFDSWQDGAGRAILAKNGEGFYAADSAVLSIPRQVGKTYLIGWIIFAMCIIRPGLTVLWTAHRYKTAGETFRNLAAMARQPKLLAHVARVTTGAGDQTIEFSKGSRILFGARERGFGRGFAEVDVLVFDEAQILTENAIDDMVPATNVAENPLILYIGTPPKPADPGEVFTRLRSEALSGESTDTLYVEFSADTEADPLDRVQWAKANPSFPSRTTARAMLRMRKNLGPDSFLREALGLWDVSVGFDLPVAEWTGLGDSSAERGAPVFGVAVAPDRSWSAVAAAWQRPDGLTQVGLTQNGYRPGATWIADHVAALRLRATNARVLVDMASRGLIPDAVEPTQQEQAQADNALVDAVTAGSVRHGNDPAVDVAFRSARWKTTGETRVLDRKGSTDISPLRAISLAFWDLTQAPSVYEERGVRFL